MNRRQHLQKAADHLGQVLEHLSRAQVIFEADADGELLTELRKFEERLSDLQDAEPRGRDTDDAYEQAVEDSVL
jgi:hypothetical protein